MKDLNILRMIMDADPGYTRNEHEVWAQRLMVILMGSEDNDVGRAYGGELAAFVGGAILSPDVLELKVKSSIKEAVEWLKANSDAPADMTADVDTYDLDGDHLTIHITVSYAGESSSADLTL